MPSGVRVPDGIPRFIILDMISLATLLLPWEAENQSVLSEWNSNMGEPL